MAYKTWLFVPASERFLSGRLEGLADTLVFDLADSIRAEDKSNARERLCRTLDRAPDAEVYVRINAGETGEEDLQSLKGCRFDGLLFPKTESAEQLLAASERFRDKKLIALVESPRGILNLEQIVRLPFLYGLAFGGEDYCRELGVETNELATQYARGRLILLAHCYQKYCLDSISMEYRDTAQFLQKYKESIAMGFDSRLLIHPAQVQAVRAWKESEMKPDEMKRIVRLFEQSNSGLVSIDGHWYERPHIERLKKRIAQAEKENAGQ